MPCIPHDHGDVSPHFADVPDGVEARIGVRSTTARHTASPLPVSTPQPPVKWPDLVRRSGEPWRQNCAVKRFGAN